MKHFSISEMLRSDTAIRRCLWNGANLEAEENLRALVEQVLDPLRERYGKPIYVNSGYRCPKLNALIGGAVNSQHMKGEAADITAGSPEENLKLAKMIEEAGKFDQLIYEKNSEAGPQWLHVSWKRNGVNRKRVLFM